MKISTHYSSKNGSFYFHHTVTEPTSDVSAIYGPESHRWFEIIYLIEGEVQYFIEGEQYLARTGDLIFILPNEIHAIQRNSKMKYERVVVSFDFNVIKDMLDLGGFTVDDSFLEMKNAVHRIIPTRLVEKYGLKDILYGIGNLDVADPAVSYRFVSAVLLLVTGLNNLFSKESSEPVFLVATDPVVKKAVDYINNHVTEQITLDEISEALHVSKSTLCHKFSEYMNTSVNRYIAAKKIYYAMRLIKNGMRATEAAESVGYEHYTTFYHNYKQIIGVSPSIDKK